MHERGRSQQIQTVCGQAADNTDAVLLAVTCEFIMIADREQKIYFAGAIRGGREDVQLYGELVRYLAGFGRVLTDHVADPQLDVAGDEGISEQAIFARDLAWLDSADLVIAEVTTPSLGVGYEIAAAEARGKPILCLFRTTEGRRSLSAMIDGNPALSVRRYADLAEAKAHIAAFVDALGGRG